MKKNTLSLFSFCAVVLLLLVSFPSVVGYLQVKSVNSEKMKEMKQALKVSWKNQKSSPEGIYGTMFFITFIINLIIVLVSTFHLSSSWIIIAAMWALLWPLEIPFLLFVAWIALVMQGQPWKSSV